MGEIIESMRAALGRLEKAGAVSGATVLEFDRITRPMLAPPQVRSMAPKDIVRLRGKLGLDTSVLTGHLNVSPSVVKKWEQGETRPTGPALRLLNVISDKGIAAILCHSLRLKPGDLRRPRQLASGKCRRGMGGVWQLPRTLIQGRGKPCLSGLGGCQQRAVACGALFVPAV